MNSVVVKEENEIEERLVSIKRVAKVVKGGRRFGFSSLMVAGDKKGLVGYGSGSGKEVANANTKAKSQAKKQFQRVPLKEGRTIHHDVTGYYGAGKVHLRSAPPGTGIIAGGPLRAVFECLGVQDIVAKSIGTSNPHNMVKACFDAFNRLNSPKLVAARRGLKVSDVIERREIVAGGKEDGRKEDNE